MEALIVNAVYFFVDWNLLLIDEYLNPDCDASGEIGFGGSAVRRGTSRAVVFVLKVCDK